MRPERAAIHSPPSRAEVKRERGAVLPVTQCPMWAQYGTAFLHRAKCGLRNYQLFTCPEIPRLFADSEVNCLVYTTHHWTLSHYSSPHTLKIHFNVIHRSMCLTRSFPFRIAYKILFAFLISPKCAEYPAHLTFPDLITLMLFGNQRKFWSFLLCNFSHPFVTSDVPNVLLSIILSNSTILFSSPARIIISLTVISFLSVAFSLLFRHIFCLFPPFPTLPLIFLPSTCLSPSFWFYFYHC